MRCARSDWISRLKACSMSVPGRERRPGPRLRPFRHCKALRCSMPTTPCARWRSHRQVKGAELPFEDERFSYVALTRAPVANHPARVLAQPEISKVEVTAKLCTPAGLAVARVPRRAKAGYANARRWRWGDAVIESQTSPTGR